MTAIERQLHSAMVAHDADAPTAAEIRAALQTSLAERRPYQPTRRRWYPMLTAVAATAFFVVAVSVYMLETPSSETSTGQVVSADSMFPDTTPRDWATFVDHLVVGRVTAERALPLEADDGEPDRGFQLREVEFSVDHVLWSREGGPPAPKMISWETFGWSFQDGQRTEVTVAGSPRLEVGHTYLVPLLFIPDTESPDDEGWSPLSPSDVLGYDEGVIDDGNGASAPNGYSWVHRDYLGSTADEVAEVLRTVKPHPEARAIMNASPLRRLNAVLDR